MTAAAAIALENARLNVELRARLEELRGSRARIVEAGDSERRRLERNLHDGAQQRLVAIALQLRLLAEPRARRPGRGGELGDGGEEELAAVARRAARARARAAPGGARARAGAALHALATRSKVPTTVRYEAPDGLPKPVELAAYFVVAEALTNVAKYAQARRRHRARSADGRRSSRSPTTGSVAPTTRAARGCAGSRTASRRSTDDCAWSARPAPGRRDRGAAVRVVIADDNLLVRAGIAGAAARRRDRGGRRRRRRPTSCCARCGADEPDVAIVDIRMPPTHTDEGSSRRTQIRERHPAMAIVILSEHLEAGTATRVLAESPERLGYLLKQRVTDVDDFVGTSAASSARRLGARPAGGVAAAGRRRADGPLRALTAREREVLQLVAEGRSNQAIAERLVITLGARRSTSRASSRSSACRTPARSIAACSPSWSTCAADRTPRPVDRPLG